MHYSIYNILIEVLFRYLFCDVYDGGRHFCSIGVGFHLDLSFPQWMGNAHSIGVFPCHWRLVRAWDRLQCDISYTDGSLVFTESFSKMLKGSENKVKCCILGL